MLHILQSGSGIPIVFLHAFPLSHHMWDINRPQFSRNFRFITLDLPGFGQSPVQGEISTMEQMAAAVLNALDELKISEKAVFVGLSMGGYVLLQILKQAPERARGLVFVSTRATADTEALRQKRSETIEKVKKDGLKALGDQMIPGLIGKTTRDSNPALVQTVRSWIERGNPQGVMAALRGMAARLDTTGLLGSVSAPALVLSGSEDAITSSAEMEAMAKALPKNEFHVIPNAGHLLNLEQPKVFADLFLHFLKRKVL